MSQENPESNLSTLNPIYLKAALDEANSYRKSERTERDAPPIRPIRHQEENGTSTPARASQDQKQVIENGASKRLDWAEGLAGHEPNLDGERAVDRFDKVSLLAKSKEAIARKQAEIAKVRKEIDRLTQAKATDFPADPAACQARLNELRLRRIAIQMELISGNHEYNDGDIIAIDGQIKDLAALSARARKSYGSVENSSELAAEIDRLQAEEQSLGRGLAKLIADHNLGVVKRKAEAYVEALKATHRLQHELLALAALVPSVEALRRVDLGGQLPRPQGLGVFVSSLPEDLSLSVEGIEEAKARLRPELAP